MARFQELNLQARAVPAADLPDRRDHELGRIEAQLPERTPVITFASAGKGERGSGVKSPRPAA
jgi:hypothetical protein